MTLIQQTTAITDDTTVSIDPVRTGWAANEPELSPAKVGSGNFGQLFATKVDGQVYAQPLVIGDTLIAATENNMVYGIHAVSGQIRWSRSLGKPWPAEAIGCGDLVPNIGVTATPVYDPTTRLVYVTAKVNDGPDVNHPHWYMFALDITSGSVHPGWPVTIQGSPVNNPQSRFNPFTAMQRPGLLLLDNEIFAGFASHCDYGPYVGYVVGVRTDTRALRMWATENGSTSGMAGVWMSGGGLVSDGPGRIFFSTGNGVSPPKGPGNRPPGQLAESVVHLSTGGPDLVAKDFFCPANANDLDSHDQDLGSGGPVALPTPPFGTNTLYPHLLVQIGKDGRVFLLNRDSLGGRKQGPNDTDLVVSMTGPYKGVWGKPAVWGGDGGYVYVPENDGALRAFKYGTTGAGVPALTSVGTSGSIGHYPGSPVVSSTGTVSGSALVWIICSTESGGAKAQLRAYDAIPGQGVLKVRWSANIGTMVKFPVPAVSNGRVYVGTSDGMVIGFGSPSQSALTGMTVDFGRVHVGASGDRSEEVTATRTVTINKVTTTSPFLIGTPPPVLPITLMKDQKFSVPVVFKPTAAGDSTATLTFDVTVDGKPGTVGFDMYGTGTTPGFAAVPPELDFKTIGTKTSRTISVSISNTGDADETVASVRLPAEPFTLNSPPKPGTVIHPSASLTVDVTYAPKVPSPPGGDHSNFALTGVSQRFVAVPLIGTAINGAPHMTITPMARNFGDVPVGGWSEQQFLIENTGNLPLTITKAAPPTAPYLPIDPIPEGLELNPGQQYIQRIRFTPTAFGAAPTGMYLITGDDSQGMQTVRFNGNGVRGGLLPPVTGWTLNGSAKLVGTELVLTEALFNQAGSAICPLVVPTGNLRGRFCSVIGGGYVGADGLTLVILDANKETDHSLGLAGSGLGYAGLQGVAITLVTFKAPGNPSDNFVGVATGSKGQELVYADIAKDTPPLRTGWRDVKFQMSNGCLQVDVDCRRVIDFKMKLPSPALIGFTGGTGAFTDKHSVPLIEISY